MIAFFTWLALAASAAIITPPPVAGVADYQLGGAYEPAQDVTIVTRDSLDPPDRSRYSICYVNAFQTQPGTTRWWKKHHPRMLLRDRAGKLVTDPGWPGEIVLDLRTATRRAELGQLVDQWFGRCAKAGYQAVEPDNLDSWTRSKKLMTRQQTITFARTMVTRAHAHGLAIAQKNTPELGRSVDFDFVVAEGCEIYHECGDYMAVYGRRMIEIEYSDTPRSAYTRACTARAGKISIMLRDRDVVPAGQRGYVYRHC